MNIKTTTRPVCEEQANSFRQLQESSIGMVLCLNGVIPVAQMIEGPDRAIESLVRHDEFASTGKVLVCLIL